ncbi:hypothetical protein FLA_1813 [Filimonas lacunae]|nr:hypothetical protein FLA_1813 [Filimonas lacunae]
MQITPDCGKNIVFDPIYERRTTKQGTIYHNCTHIFLL